MLSGTVEFYNLPLQSFFTRGEAGEVFIIK